MTGSELMFEWRTVMPTVFPALYGLLMLAFVPALKRDRRWLWGVAVGGMLVSIAIPLTMLVQWVEGIDAFETAGAAGAPMVRLDQLALWLDILFGIAGLLAVLVMPAYLDRLKAHRPEIYPLTFLALAGMTIMVATENLVVVFLGLEALSIPLYIACGLARDKHGSVEAALKYFLLGAFSTGFLVYGIALIYGGAGSLDLSEIGAAVAAGGGEAGLLNQVMLLAGIGLFLVAFGFKVGAVPFHFWVPDVYQGAPTPVTAFMAAGTKAAAFGVLLRALHAGFTGSGAVESQWIAALSFLAVLTMVGGNLLALVQQRVKRLLAYSSVAHAGYILLALIAPVQVGTANAVFYLLAYTFMTVGAFIVVSLFQEEGEDADHISHFSGLWQRRPVLAAAMALFMLSLIGIPPLGGFTGKYVIFMAALDGGHPILAAVMGVSAVIGAAYYLRVIVAMFLRAPERRVVDEIRVPLAATVALTVAVAGTLALGLIPSFVLSPLYQIYLGLTPLP
jgi:NADH-quinone oxidoreductase subunit N